MYWRYTSCRISKGTARPSACSLERNEERHEERNEEKNEERHEERNEEKARTVRVRIIVCSSRIRTRVRLRVIVRTIESVTERETEYSAMDSNNAEVNQGMSSTTGCRNIGPLKVTIPPVDTQEYLFYGA